jgi:hypothetical protein
VSAPNGTFDTGTHAVGTYTYKLTCKNALGVWSTPQTRTVTVTNSDNDGDGIPNATDSCPGVAGPAPLGCPMGTLRVASFIYFGSGACYDRLYGSAGSVTFTITPMAPTPGSPFTVTTDSGGYLYKSVPAGTYRVSHAPSSFIPSAYPTRTVYLCAASYSSFNVPIGGQSPVRDFYYGGDHALTGDGG